MKYRCAIGTTVAGSQVSKLAIGPDLVGFRIDLDMR
jgi:hypothetical protein